MCIINILTNTHILQQEVDKEITPKEFTFQELKEYMSSNSSSLFEDNMVSFTFLNLIIITFVLDRCT